MESSSKNKHNSSKTQNKGINLMDFIRLCLKRWKWFVLWVAIMTAVTVLYLVVKQPSWKQSAEVLVKDQTGVGDLQAQFGGLASTFGLFGAPTTVYNEMIAMKTPFVIDRVVERLHLDVLYIQTDFPRRQLYGSTLPVTVELQNVSSNEQASFSMCLNTDGTFSMKKFKKEKEKFSDEVSGTVNTTVSTPIGKVKITANATVMAKMEEAIHLKVVKRKVMKIRENILKVLSLDLESKEGTVLLVEFTDVSRERANDLINNIIKVYQEDWKNDKEDVARASYDFVSDRLMAVQQELGDYDSSIADFQSRSKLIDGEETAKAFIDKASSLEAATAELSSQVYVLEYVQRFMKEHSDNSQILPQGVLGSENGIENQIQQYNNLILHRRNIVRNSSEDNPILKDTEDQLNSLRNVILASIDNSIKNTKIRLKETQARENKVNDMISGTPQKINKMKNVGRNQQVKEALYMFLLQKREENEMNMRFITPNLRVLSPPSGVVKPASPRILRMLALGIFLGLLFPAVYFYVRESIKPRLRNRKDAESLNIPLLSEVPVLTERKKQQVALASHIQVTDGVDDELNNAFRTVRTKIDLELAKHPDDNVVMFTSLEKGSGKTFAIMNLATAFSVGNKRVLVIDTDLRHAGINRYLNANTASRGLSDYLSGRVTSWKELLQHNNECARVDLLPVGTIPDNPAELIGCERFPNILHEVKKEYDVVLLDSTDMSSYSEVPYIEREANLVVVVLRDGETELSDLKTLRKHFVTKEEAGMAILLNAVAKHII